jgi:hypothetical protein
LQAKLDFATGDDKQNRCNGNEIFYRMLICRLAALATVATFQRIVEPMA